MDPITGLIILSLFALFAAGCGRDENGSDSGAPDAEPPDLPVEGGRHERDIPDVADARDAMADFFDANADTSDARLDEYRYDSFEYSDRPGDAARELSDLISGDRERDSDFSEASADSRDAGVDVPVIETGRDATADLGVPDVAAERRADAGVDRAPDAAADRRPDAGADAGPDEGADYPPDAGVDRAPDRRLDAGVDAGPDESADYPVDAGVDRAPDAALDGSVEASVDLTPVDIIDVNLDSIPTDAATGDGAARDAIDRGSESAADRREAAVDVPVFETGRDAMADLGVPDAAAERRADAGVDYPLDAGVDRAPDAAADFSLDAPVESFRDASIETLSDRPAFDVFDRSAEVSIDARDFADTAPPEPGINYNAFTFPGPISDLDSPEAGVIIALGGSPAKLYRCTVSGIAPATCNVMAEFNKPETAWSDPLLPAGMNPLDYFSVGSGVGLVNFWSSSDRGRIILAKLNETAPVSNSVVAYDTLELPAADRDWRLSTGGITAAPSSIPGPPHWRFFTPLGYYNPVRHVYARSVVEVHSDEYGSPLRRDWVAYSNGYNPSCTASMRMNLPSDAGVVERSVLVLYSAGLIDAAHHYPAQLAVHDPVSPAVNLIKTISVGDVDAENLPECSVAPSRRDIHMVYGNPARRFASVNIETDAAVEIPLGASLSGYAAGVAADSSNAYVADSAGRIVFLDLSSRTVLGRKTLPDAPTAVVVSGSHVYSAAGNRLVAIDPATVGLE